MSHNRRFGAGERRLLVLIDMDMVIADFEGYFLQRFREKFPEEPFVPLEERRTFYLKDQYVAIGPDLPAKVEEILHEEGFFDKMPPIPGALQAATEIANMEMVDVFLCTTPLMDYEFCLRDKYAWVEKNLGAEWLSRIIITRDKTIIQGHLLIDDCLPIKGVNKNPSWKHVVFTTYSNMNLDDGDRLRLRNWTDGAWRELIEDFKKRV